MQVMHFNCRLEKQRFVAQQKITQQAQASQPTVVSTTPTSTQAALIKAQLEQNLKEQRLAQKQKELQQQQQQQNQPQVAMKVILSKNADGTSTLSRTLMSTTPGRPIQPASTLLQKSIIQPKASITTQSPGGKE